MKCHLKQNHNSLTLRKTIEPQLSSLWFGNGPIDHCNPVILGRLSKEHLFILH